MPNSSYDGVRRTEAHWQRCLYVCNFPAVLAYTVAALSPTMDVANALLPVYVTTLLFFGGFLFTYDAMPPWWKWYSYINPLRWVKELDGCNCGSHLLQHAALSSALGLHGL
eukprot:GHUV01037426.1.p1 GENE.GHUV01037426.1~~GHUV01037426.1.p1  ORF type:complete len:111 (+),score=18.41 GHUV01037426.1:84-416(+)